MPLGVIDGPGPKEEGKMRERERGAEREERGHAMQDGGAGPAEEQPGWACSVGNAP